MFEDVRVYGNSPLPFDPYLTPYDWQDWAMQMEDEYGEEYSLSVSEKSPDPELTDALSQYSEFVWFEKSQSYRERNIKLDLLVQVPENWTKDLLVDIGEQARHLFTTHFRKSPPVNAQRPIAPIDPDDPPPF